MERRSAIKKGLAFIGATFLGKIDIYPRILQAVAQDQKKSEGSWPTDKEQIEKLIQSEAMRPGGLIAYKDPCKEQYNKKEFMDKFDGC